MSTLRTYNLQNPDSSNVNIELTQGSGAVVAGVTTFSSNVKVSGNLTVDGALTYEDVTNIDSVGVITARKGIVSSGVVTATAFHGDGSQLTGIDATQIVTGNTSVQTVDTGSDGHVKVNTEGSERLRITSAGNIGIDGTTAPRAKFDFGSGTGNGTLNQTVANYQAVFEAPQGTGNYTRNIAFAVGTNGIGAAINAVDNGGNDATGLIFATGTAGSIAERLRIDSAGRMLLGTTTEGHVSADDFTVAGSGDVGITIRSGTGSEGSIMFSDGTSGADEYRGWINYNQNSNFMRFFTNATERLRLDSGGNVNFGAEKTVSFPSGTGIQVYNSSAPRIKLVNDTTGNAASDGLQIYVSGSSAIFDQKENAEMRFYTNATERVRITSDGKMGVGCTPSLSYGNGIHIAGGNAGLKLQNTNNGDWAYVEYADESNTTKFIQGYRDSSGVYSIRPGTTLNATSGISLTSDGLMGLGTNNPSSYVGGGENLVIADSSDAGMTIASGTSNSGTINFADGASGDARYRGRVEYSHSLDALDILTAATTQIRIDNSGRVLLGTLNSTGTQLIKVNGDTSATTNGGHIALTQGRTSPGNGATHGVISFGTETRPEQVKVVSFVDGTWTDGQYHPSGLYIATTDYNRNSPTEKIRITDIGEVNCYSTGSVIQAGTLQGGGYNAYFYEGRRNQNTGGTRTYVVWSNGNVTNTNNSYGSISDQRLKENIVDATSQWDDIKSLQIRKYNFREATGNETHTQLGLIAQEAESVSPGLVQTTAVSEGDVLQDADGNQMESVKSINYSVLYMKSVKALQEAQARIEALEARVTTLEG